MGPAGVPSYLTLHIDSGYYAGLIYPCEANTVTLGSDTGADVALVAEELEPIHLRIEASAQAVSLQALGPDASVEARQLSPRSDAEEGSADSMERAGPSKRIELAVDEQLDELDPLVPVVVRIGELRLRFVHRAFQQARERSRMPLTAGPPPMPVTPDDGRRRTQLVALLLLPLVAALAIRMFTDGRTTPPGGDAVIARPSAPSTLAAPTLPPDTVEADVATQRALGALRERIDTREMRGITLRLDGNTVVATGTVPETTYERWKGLQIWFDAMHGEDTALVSDVTPLDERPMEPPRIDAVWTGEDPHVISRGDKYPIGSRMPDGWVLSAIEGDHVLVERKGKQLKVEM